MAIGRETIYAALFSQLFSKLDVSNGGPFQTTSRRVQSVGQLQIGDQPALFMTTVGERNRHTVLGAPPITDMMATLYVYAMVDEMTDVPDTVINNLMDTIENAVSPSAINAQAGDGSQTLGDLVQRVWIDGRLTAYGTGAAGRQSVSVVQISMMANH